MRGKPSPDQSSVGVSGCLGRVAGLDRGGFSTDSFFFVLFFCFFCFFLMVFDWFWSCLVWFVCFFWFVVGGFLDWSVEGFPRIVCFCLFFGVVLVFSSWVLIGFGFAWFGLFF